MRLPSSTTALAACGAKCLDKMLHHCRENSVIAVYDFRRLLRDRARRATGLRDELRDDLAAHYDASTKTFSKGFVVGAVGGMCERAYAAAAGVSEITYARARADVTKGRHRAASRRAQRSSRKSAERAHLEAWIRSQQETMEQNKSTDAVKYYTEKTTERQLWSKYLASCDRANRPSIGNSRLLHKIWKDFKNIREVGPTGHDICDTCRHMRPASGAARATRRLDRRRFCCSTCAHRGGEERPRRLPSG